MKRDVAEAAEGGEREKETAEGVEKEDRPEAYTGGEVEEEDEDEEEEEEDEEEDGKKKSKSGGAPEGEEVGEDFRELLFFLELLGDFDRPR